MVEIPPYLYKLWEQHLSAFYKYLNGLQVNVLTQAYRLMEGGVVPPPKLLGV